MARKKLSAVLSGSKDLTRRRFGYSFRIDSHARMTFSPENLEVSCVQTSANPGRGPLLCLVSGIRASADFLFNRLRWKRYRKLHLYWFVQVKQFVEFFFL